MNKIESAHYINNGACNPKAIARTLHELLQADARDFDALRADACYRVIVGQLGYLFDVSIGASIEDMQAVDGMFEQKKISEDQTNERQKYVLAQRD